MMEICDDLRCSFPFLKMGRLLKEKRLELFVRADGGDDDGTVPSVLDL